MKNKIKLKFKKNGFVTFKNVLPLSQKKIIKEIIFFYFKDVCHPYIKNLNFDIEDIKIHKKIINYRKNYPKKFGEIYDKINLDARLRSLFYTNQFFNYFAKALGVKTNSFFINGFMMRFDVPFDQRNSLKWHQDSAYYEMSAPKFNAGVCWLGVTENTINNGAQLYIPNSSNKYILTKGVKKNKYSSQKLEIQCSKLELAKQKHLLHKFGDMSLLHMNLKHRSGINKSEKVRITIGCRFHEISKEFNTGKEIYKFNNAIKF